MRFGWVRNNTRVPQYCGLHGVEPNAVGLLPLPVIESLRQKPIRELTVISDHPELWVFKQTGHRPFSARYRHD